MKYKICYGDDEVYDTFEEAAGIWIHNWGNGGGCYSIEIAIKDIDGKTKAQWKKNSKKSNTGQCPCAYQDVVNTILAEIKEVKGDSNGEVTKHQKDYWHTKDKCIYCGAEVEHKGYPCCSKCYIEHLTSEERKRFIEPCRKK